MEMDGENLGNLQSGAPYHSLPRNSWLMESLVFTSLFCCCSFSRCHVTLNFDFLHIDVSQRCSIFLVRGFVSSCSCHNLLSYFWSEHTHVLSYNTKGVCFFSPQRLRACSALKLQS